MISFFLLVARDWSSMIFASKGSKKRLKHHNNSGERVTSTGRYPYRAFFSPSFVPLVFVIL
ncbi:hypothetical protein KFK09_011851 [Dendrobium nobile]|uniref:Uncharacterized protein n=1 Tax=Dendrobium nobile TaxID=94219 RepID=A0A8T3BE09_DENNO|nr:hypothetical protein KFK09_011851 [Dendrobium nobile]